MTFSNSEEFKDELKESLTIEQVHSLVYELGGNPKEISNDRNYFVAQTICHNKINDGSYKLYYYDNTHLFICYTECGTFDIFELIIKIHSDWSLPKAINYVANFFGISYSIETDNLEELPDWKIIKKYQENSEIKNIIQEIEIKTIDEELLLHYPQPRIIPWEKDNISQEIMKSYGIRYDPINAGIIIPHYNKNNGLIGIRERTLIQEYEQYGKYKPAIIHGQMYSHPLGFNLYNLNNSKKNIQVIKKAIIFESEKACLQYASYFGKENDISVAICGSNISTYQIDLLLGEGVKEIIIALDREGSWEEKNKWLKKFYMINHKFSKYTLISFIYDKYGDYLDYKDSPTDKGKDVFLELYKERIML